MLAILGPTASGKSGLAMELARYDRRVELVSVDSMQVYRGMDIGTAKPTQEEQAEVRHHVIDVVDPWVDYSLSAFKQAANAAIEDVESRAKVPVLVGGTGLHLRAVIDALDIPGQYPEVRASFEDRPTSELYAQLVELDPDAATKMEPTNRRRIERALEVCVGSGQPFSSFGPGMDAYPAIRFKLLGLRRPRADIDQRITERYAQQIADGFVAEVQRLVDPATPGLSRTAAQALGYRQIAAYLRGECTLDEALDTAIGATKKFARRQERWFRRDPRINWVDIADNPMEAWPALMRDYEACT